MKNIVEVRKTAIKLLVKYLEDKTIRYTLTEGGGMFSGDFQLSVSKEDAMDVVSEAARHGARIRFEILFGSDFMPYVSIYFEGKEIENDEDLRKVFK